MKKIGAEAAAVTLALCLLPACGPAGTAFEAPRRILVTNDNGIDDAGLVELARALARTKASVVVVASQTDRSGASNYMSATRAGRFVVQRRDLGEGIEAYALDGQPADCVIFALSGPMRDDPPDLVVSGINGGPNLGDDWFGSGTIGAARTAAYVGIPAIAVSGVEDDDPAAVAAAATWVAGLVGSELVAGLEAPEYLTVSLPERVTRRPDVRLVRRARGLLTGGSTPGDTSADGTQTWDLRMEVDPSKAGADTDVAAVSGGDIAIVAMRVDESDPQLASRLGGLLSSVPPWPADAASPLQDPDCDRTLGIEIDDVEDEEGREWGVWVETVEPDGRAADAGLQPGDVIVRFNEASLATGPGEEDPDERFVRLFRRTPCGDPVQLEILREGEYSKITLVVGG